MKTRKVFLMMVAVFSMVALFAVSAHAGWNLCTVVQVGPGWGTSYVRLTQDSHPDNQDTTFSNKWFRPRSDSVREMLATALVAKSNNDQLWIYSDMGGGYPQILAMYLGAPPVAL